MLTSLPAPGPNAFSTTFRYSSDGSLFAWDGFHVWKESGVNVDSFNQLGTVIFSNDGGAHNDADAGPINFSGDGQRILLGNGDGDGEREGPAAGLIWSMPISGGTVSLPAGTQPVGTVPYHYDFLPVPSVSTIPGDDTKYLVNQGTSSYSSSSISVFDESTGTNTTVVSAGPGASTTLAFNPKNDRLYVGLGYGDDRGKIYSFGLNQIDQAFETNNPLDFAAKAYCLIRPHRTTKVPRACSSTLTATCSRAAMKESLASNPTAPSRRSSIWVAIHRLCTTRSTTRYWPFRAFRRRRMRI